MVNECIYERGGKFDCSDLLPSFSQWPMLYAPSANEMILVAWSQWTDSALHEMNECDCAYLQMLCFVEYNYGDIPCGLRISSCVDLTVTRLLCVFSSEGEAVLGHVQAYDTLS